MHGTKQNWPDFIAAGECTCNFSNGKSSGLIFGLGVESDFPLPLRPLNKNNVDLRIHDGGAFNGNPTWLERGRFMELVRENYAHVLRYRLNGNSAVEYHYSRGGRDIVVRHSHMRLRDILMLLLGSGLGAFLQFQGLFTIHASGVVVDGKALLFAGESGVGKSSLTSFLVSKGYPLLCDDLAPVVFENEHCTIYPGHPLLKINENAIQRLKLRPGTILPLTSLEAWVHASSFCGKLQTKPVPLGGIYLLAGRKKGLRTPLIQHLSCLQGCLELTRHRYGERWINPGMRKTLATARQIASSVTIRQVVLPDNLDRLQACATTITRDSSI